MTRCKTGLKELGSAGMGEVLSLLGVFPLRVSAETLKAVPSLDIFSTDLFKLLQLCQFSSR